MNFGSLCTGCGGLDLGLEQAGLECIWQAESDKACKKVLLHHYPGIPNYGDILNTDWNDVEKPDLLTAGFPCQPFSYAGKRLGEEDRRWLWPAVADAIRILQPRLALIENVPGIMRPMVGGPGIAPIGVFLADLAELGYDARWSRIRAADVGAPHIRSRVFIIAWKRTVANTFGKRQNGGGVEGKQEKPEIWRALTAGSPKIAPDSNGGRIQRDSGATSSAKEESGWMGEEHGNFTRNIGQDASDTDSGRRESIGKQKPQGVEGERRHEPDGHRQIWEFKDTTNASDSDDSGRGEQCRPIATQEEFGSSQRGGSETRGGGVEWGVFGRAIEQWERLTRDSPRPTDSLGRLSPRFSEWMMGFPEGWVDVDGVSRTAQLRMLGNSVQVQVGETIGRYLVEIYGT